MCARDEPAEDSHEKELNAYVFERQTDLYLEAARNAATIATSADAKPDPKAVDDAKRRFKQLYWGDLVVVEDRRIEIAMIVFEDCMDNNHCTREGRPVKKDLQPDTATIQNFSLELAACIREGLEKDRHIDFGTLTGKLSTVCPYD